MRRRQGSRKRDGSLWVSSLPRSNPNPDSPSPQFTSRLTRPHRARNGLAGHYLEGFHSPSPRSIPLVGFSSFPTFRYPCRRNLSLTRVSRLWNPLHKIILASVHEQRGQTMACGLPVRRLVSLSSLALIFLVLSGMGEPSASSTAIVYPASSTHSSPFASPSPRKQQTSSLKSFIRIYGPAVSLEVTRSHTPLRLRSRAMPVELDSSDLSNASQDSAPPKPPASQHKTPPSPTNAASANRASSQPAAANSSPKAKAVVHDPSSPFWSNAGGIFQPDAQNPIAVSTADAQALQPLVNPIDQ